MSAIGGRDTVICIVGPTASGKSELAQCVAEALNGEIISADSMQIYRGMDIGTAKVLPDQRRVPHHGIDLVDPGEAYSAALFQEYARKKFDEISSRGKASVLVGGSGFYIRAAIDDYDFPDGEQQENPVREMWEHYLDTFGAVALWEKLNELDSASAKAIHPNNAKRVVRALEMHAHGVSYAEQLEALQAIRPFKESFIIGLGCPKEILNERINGRVDIMRETGLEDEVRHLLDAGFRQGLTSQHAIGYKEIVDAFDGGRSLDQAYEDIKQATRRYGKRQRTWFRKDKRIHWVDALYSSVALEASLELISKYMKSDLLQ